MEEQNKFNLLHQCACGCGSDLMQSRHKCLFCKAQMFGPCCEKTNPDNPMAGGICGHCPESMANKPDKGYYIIIIEIINSLF